MSTRTSGPLVSIVMPVRDEAAYIERSLGSALAQSHRPLEILVVDGMSRDGTRERVHELATDYPEVPVQLLDNPKQTAPYAMNIGLRAARGEVIVRIDGHCEVGRDYVTNALRHLDRDDVDGVGGPLDTVGETPMARAIAVAMGSRFGVGGSAFRTSDTDNPSSFVDRFVDTVAFPAYTRAMIAKVGGYDEQLRRNQDDEYNYRLRKGGGGVLLAGDMPARYYSRGSLRSLARQYAQYGFYKVRVLQKHPKQMSLRQFVPPLFVASLAVSAVASIWLGPWPLVALVGAYGAANLFSALAALRAAPHTDGLKTLPTLSAAYALIHLGYGAGFLVGLAAFAHRWGDSADGVPDLGWNP